MRIERKELSSSAWPAEWQSQEQLDLTDCTFRDVDASGVTLSVDVRDSGFARVVFDGAIMNEWVDGGSTFTECSFRNTRFHGGCFADSRVSVYESCTFAGCHFERTHFHPVLFRECVFESNTFERISSLWHAAFERCTFRGLLDGVVFGVGGAGVFGPDWFRRLRRTMMDVPYNQMAGVDWSGAELGLVHFMHGVDLSTIVLPQRGRCRHYDRWPERVAHVATAYQEQNDDVKTEVRMMLAYNLGADVGESRAPYVSGKAQRQYIVSEDYWRKTHGDAATDFVLAHLELGL